MADVTYTNIPGQPALTPSPMEDAFKVLASYMGGQQLYRQKTEADAKDNLKLWIESGGGDIDLSGGLTAPKYISRPTDQRPAYLTSEESKAKTEYYKAEAAAKYGEANMYNNQNIGKGKVTPKDAWASYVKGLSTQDRVSLKTQLAHPVERQKLKDFYAKKLGIQAVEMDPLLNQV
jgi:hypothetical protein